MIFFNVLLISVCLDLIGHIETAHALIASLTVLSVK